MNYKNGKTYEGEYGGIKIRFTLSNYRPEVVEQFNEALVQEGLKRVQEDRQTDRCSRI